MPHLEKVWKPLTSAVHNDDMLGYVQKIEHEFGNTAPSMMKDLMALGCF